MQPKDGVLYLCKARGKQTATEGIVPAFRGFSTAKAVPLRAATIGRRLHCIRCKETGRKYLFFFYSGFLKIILKFLYFTIADFDF